MLNIRKHRAIMFEILQDIYRSPAGAYLAFKGGTMLYFFHGLDRFSVDLDFDLLDESKKDLVSQEIVKILETKGKIKDQMEKRFILFFLLSYGDGERGIKIEISKRNPLQNRYELKNFYGVDVKVMKLEDSFSNKLIAAVERKRTANRDFYDIYFLLRRQTDFNQEIIMERTGKNGREFLLYLRKYLDKNCSEKGMLDGIGELLDEKRKQWVRTSLKKELGNLIDFVIEEGNK